MSKKWADLPSWVRAKIIKSKQVKVPEESIAQRHASQDAAMLAESFALLEHSRIEQAKRDAVAGNKSRVSFLDSLSEDAFSALVNSVGKRNSDPPVKKINTRIPSTKI